MADDIIVQARRISELLAKHQIKHAFIGGLAMNAWSIPVPTYDIDLCADLTPDQVPGLLAHLERAGFIPPASSWIESIGPAKFQEFTVHWPLQSGLRAADIFLATDAFQRSALSRRRNVELEEGFHTDVIAPEDLLLYKLVAWRHKDRAAIERLLMVQSALDWTYVREWAIRLRVDERLVESLRESGLNPP